MLGTALAARRPRFNLQLRAFRFEGLASPAIRGGQPGSGTLASRRGPLLKQLLLYGCLPWRMVRLIGLIAGFKVRRSLRPRRSASTGSFTAFLASRASCCGTLVSGHGDSATGASSPATYGRRIRASAWRQYQAARVDRRGELSVTPASTLGARTRPFPESGSGSLPRISGVPTPGQRCRPQVVRVVDQPPPASLNAAPCLRECPGFPG